MDMTSIVTLLVYAALIIFLAVLSCIIYQFQTQTRVHPPGHFNLPRQCQLEMQESANVKNLQKMKKMRSDRKIFLNPSNPSKPQARSNIWISGDFVERIPNETDEASVKDPKPKGPHGTQICMYYQNEVDGGITEIMTSIKNDLEDKGLHLNGPEATKNLKKTAVEEWTNSFNEGKAKY